MKKTKDRIVSIIALLVTVLYPCLFMYFLSAFKTVLKFIKAIIDNIVYKAAFENLFIIASTRINTIYFLVVMGCFFVVLLYIFIKKVADGMIALKIIGLVFTILIVINFVSAIPAITNRYFSEKTVGSDDAITAFKFEDTKPNVYYFNCPIYNCLSFQLCH